MKKYWEFESGDIEKSEKKLHDLIDMLSQHWICINDKPYNYQFLISTLLIPTIEKINKKYPSVRTEELNSKVLEKLFFTFDEGVASLDKQIDIAQDLSNIYMYMFVLQGVCSISNRLENNKYLLAVNTIVHLITSKQNNNHSNVNTSSLYDVDIYKTLTGFCFIFANRILKNEIYNKNGNNYLQSMNYIFKPDGFFERNLKNKERIDDVKFMYALTCILEGYLKSSTIEKATKWANIIHPILVLLQKRFELLRRMFLFPVGQDINEKMDISVMLNARIGYFWFELGLMKNDMLMINSGLKMRDMLVNNMNELFTLPSNKDMLNINFSLGLLYVLEIILLELSFREKIK